MCNKFKITLNIEKKTVCDVLEIYVVVYIYINIYSFVLIRSRSGGRQRNSYTCDNYSMKKLKET